MKLPTLLGWFCTAVCCLAAAGAPADTATEPGAIEVTLQSAEGPWRLRAQGARLTLFDAHEQRRLDMPLRDRQGREAHGVVSLHAVAARRCLVVVLRGLNELWEINLDPEAPPQWEGWVHDYRMGEGHTRPGFLALRRTELPRPIDAAWVDPERPWVVVMLTRRADDTSPTRQLLVLNLDIRRAVAQLNVGGEPLLAQAQLQTVGDTSVLVVPNPSLGPPLRLDARRWVELPP